MINIRSITYTLPQKFDECEFKKIENCNMMWDNFSYYIRTKRIALTPTKEPIEMSKIDSLCNFCSTVDIRWFNIPIDYDGNPKLFEFAYSVIRNYDQSFVNVLCVKNGKINYDCLQKSLNLIKKVSNISQNGKDNFRLGLSTNIKESCPFFPFSMSSGKFGFSIALELTQEINRLIESNLKLNLNEFRDLILKTLIPQIEEIEKQANKISKENNLEFLGFDFSLAPIIDPYGSIITILNYIGINDFSHAGTMFATAYLTNILKYLANKFKSVGFSGVMYSLLEDLELCKINNDKGVRVEDMIKLSTMCGCGLDMAPIPTDISDEQIKTLIIEIIGISCRLNKPLGIRILPIPHSNNGEEVYTKFNEDADFISNTKVLSIGNNEIIERNIDSFEFLKFIS